MMINIKILINSLGKTYQDIIDSGLIPYKTKPIGDSGSKVMNLDMAREGILLTFGRDNQKLIEITLRLVDEKNKNYVFPNELPSPLWDGMNQTGVRERFGKPIHNHPPHKIVNRTFGGVDYYKLSKGSCSIIMLVRYNIDLKAVSITFKPATLLDWKPLPESVVIK